MTLVEVAAGCTAHSMPNKFPPSHKLNLIVEFVDFVILSMAAKVDAKAQEALGENAGTVIGIGKEAFATETTGTTKTLYEAEISGKKVHLHFEA